MSIQAVLFDRKYWTTAEARAHLKASGHQPHIDIGIPIFHLGYKTY